MDATVKVTAGGEMVVRFANGNSVHYVPDHTGGVVEAWQKGGHRMFRAPNCGASDVTYALRIAADAP